MQKEEWYQKAVSKFPQFKRDKRLPAEQQGPKQAEAVYTTCNELRAYGLYDLLGVHALTEWRATKGNNPVRHCVNQLFEKGETA